jgi:hypothetical protein
VTCRLNEVPSLKAFSACEWFGRALSKRSPKEGKEGLKPRAILGEGPDFLGRDRSENLRVEGGPGDLPDRHGNRAETKWLTAL